MSGESDEEAREGRDVTATGVCGLVRIPSIPEEEEEFQQRKGRAAIGLDKEEGELESSSDESTSIDDFYVEFDDGNSESCDETPGMSPVLPSFPPPDASDKTMPKGIESVGIPWVKMLEQSSNI